MRRQTLLLFILAIGLSSSCKDKKGQTPIPPETNTREYQLTETKVIEAQLISPNESNKALPQKDISSIWGDRLTYNTPTKLQIKNDSLYIFKPEDLIERYVVKWEGDNFLLRKGESHKWRICGTRNGDFTEVVLNIGLIKATHRNATRTLDFISQGYDYQSYTALSLPLDAKITWTRINFVFKKQ